MKKIMIDIETLGTSANSAIVSIGAVMFDDIQLGTSFHRRVDIDSCLKLGMTVSGATICWWMEQSEVARKLFTSRGAHITNVLDSFIRAFPWDCIEEVWANGTDLDLANLVNAFDRTGLRCPWGYYKARDYRTVRKLFPPELVRELGVQPRVEHDALDDAMAQARTLQALLNSEFAAQRWVA